MNVTPVGIVPALSVWTVAGFVATAVPANVTVITELGAKPEPVTVTVVPTAPVVGLRDAVGTVIVKVAEAGLPFASVARTVLAPEPEPAGTVNEAENVPVALVVVVVTVLPAKVIVIAEFSEKPEPVTVTDVPLGPEVGFRDIVGGLTVKVAWAELKLASVA